MKNPKTLRETNAFWPRRVIAFAGKGGFGGCFLANCADAMRRDSLRLQAAWERQMRPAERRDGGRQDLLRSRLDQIVDFAHPLAKLARTIDWSFLEARLGAA